MPLKLFENLRNGHVNPLEVLKTQVKFKSDIRRIRTGSNKSQDHKNTIRNTIFFNLREKIIQLFRDYSFLLSEAKCKAKYGERSQNINS